MTTVAFPNITGLIECLFSAAQRPAVDRQVVSWTGLYAANRPSKEEPQRIESRAALCALPHQDPLNDRLLTRVLDRIKLVSPTTYGVICEGPARLNGLTSLGAAKELDDEVVRARNLVNKQIEKARQQFGDVERGGIIQTLKDNCETHVSLGDPFGDVRLIMTGYRLRMK